MSVGVYVWGYVGVCVKNKQNIIFSSSITFALFEIIHSDLLFEIIVYSHDLI